ncbi:MAG: hypothetical protein RLZZ458_2510 [Planctomycetota bacterium]|jgi:hypothetical protein
MSLVMSGNLQGEFLMVMAALDGDWEDGLRSDLQRALVGLPAADLQLDRVTGGVQIRGRVSTWHEKQLAQEIVRRLCPELRICNAARVDGNKRSGGSLVQV